MSPRTKSGAATKPTEPRPRVRPADEDIAELNEALDDADAGRGVQLSADELKKWAETGELPCLESSPSRRRS